MIETLPADQAERVKATGTVDKNMVVLAGAGTGKTRILIDRLTLLILDREIPVEKIVALTFTKKAAEEMRERLETRLREEKTKVELAAKALEDLPKAKIGTIHSFAGDLLRLFPLQAGVDPKFREDKGPVAESVFEECWNDWTKKELGAESPRGAQWSSVLNRVALSELREFAFTILSPMVDLKALRESPDIRSIAKVMANILEKICATHPINNRARSFNPAIEALKTIFSYVDQKKTIPDELLELIDKAKSPPQGWEDTKDILKEMVETAEAIGRVDEPLFQQMLDLVEPIVSRVRRELARRGAVSFDGLLVFARNLLRDNVTVRNVLKRRFAAFLVDEFQDTDPLQGEMVFYLAEKPSGAARRWQDVQLDPGKLFVVGDPKQSIYRFRGADIAAFQAFEQHMIRQGAEQATLSVNFRSSENILGFVNAVFPTEMKEVPFIQPAYAPLEPRAGAEKNAAPVKILRINGLDENLNALNRRRVEAQTIADRIEECIKEGFRYDQIAVLLRSGPAFEAYIETFRGRGIPYLAEGEKTFYRTTEVVDFLNLLAVVANPDNKLALAGVLRSPIGGLTDKELLDLSLANGWSVKRAPDAFKNKIGALYRTLFTLSEEAKWRPLPEIVKQTLARTWALELAAASAHGEQAAANVLKIGHLAETWNAQTPMTLAAFVRRLTRYHEDARDEGENPLADVKYNAVKVLTIHKAKGLEFPVVILPNLSAGKATGLTDKTFRRDWSTGMTGLRLEDSKITNAAMALIEREEQKRLDAEEVRVFYVAATRAKDRLICLVDGDPAKGGLFSRMVNRAEALPEVDIEEINADPAQRTDFSKPLFAPSKDWDPSALAARASVWAGEEESARVTPLVTSPTALLGEFEKKVFVDEDFEESRDRAIKIGHICHKVLEEWEFKPVKKGNAKLKPALARAAKLFDVDPGSAEGKSILKEATEILGKFFQGTTYQKLCGVKILAAELPFVDQTLDGAVMRGSIDLLYEHNGQLVVADYKTNKLGDRSRSEFEKHYAAQGEAYRRAVEKALGRPATFELIFLRD